MVKRITFFSNIDTKEYVLSLVTRQYKFYYYILGNMYLTGLAQPVHFLFV